MRRIYESRALRRDENDPFSPTDSGRNDKPQSFRWVPSTWLSRNLIPHWLRHRVVSVSIDTPKSDYPFKSSVPFTFSVKNVAPFPVTLNTRSPVFWDWTIDGYTQASHVPTDSQSTESGRFTIGRGDRLRIQRRWSGMFKVSDSEWEWAEPGEYTLGAYLNIDDAAKKQLTDEVTVRITPR